MPSIFRIQLCIAAVIALISHFSLAQDLQGQEANVRVLDCGGVDAFIRKTSGVLVRAKLLKIDATGIKVESKGKEFVYRNSIVKSVRALDGNLQYNPGKESFGEFLAGLDNSLEELSIVFEEAPLVVDVDDSANKKPNRFVEPNPEKSSTPESKTDTTTTTESKGTDTNASTNADGTPESKTTTQSTDTVPKNPFVEVTESTETTGDSNTTMTKDATDSDATSSGDSGIAGSTTDDSTVQENKPTPPKLVVPPASTLPQQSTTTSTATQTTGTTPTASTPSLTNNSAIAWMTQSKAVMAVVVLIVVGFLFKVFS